MCVCVCVRARARALLRSGCLHVCCSFVLTQVSTNEHTDIQIYIHKDGISDRWMDEKKK